MIEDVQTIHEDDGDDLGSLMGWHLYGDVTFEDVELFMASEEVADAFPDGVRGGWDVREDYVRKVPAVFGWRYVYAGAPGRGARKVTVIEQYRFWEHWCHNHPLEGATTGIPPARVSDAEPKPGDRYIYLCRACATEFHAREEAARADAVRALELEGARA